MNPTDLAKRRYTIRFWIAIVAYIAIVMASVRVLDGGLSGPLRVLVALTPLIPIVVIFVCFVQFMQNIDELERQIHIESLAIAAGITAILSVTYGFLEVAHLPRPTAWCTYAVVMLSWCIAKPFVSRRYKG